MKKTILFIIIFIALLIAGCSSQLKTPLEADISPETNEGLPVEASSGSVGESEPQLEPIQTIDYTSNSLRALLPDGKIAESVTRSDLQDIDDSVNRFVLNLENIPKEIDVDIKKAVSALALCNPVFTPNEVMASFSKCFLGFQTNEDGWAYYFDNYMYIGGEALDIDPLSFALAHELNHALSFCYKPEVFPYYVEDIQGMDWGGRMSEGLADLYAFAALGGELIQTEDLVTLKSYWHIDAPATYPYEQASALMFLNSLGREITGKAYYGTEEDHKELADYYTSLTGRPLEEFLGAAERLVAYSYTFSDQPPNVDDVNNAGKEYMDLILELCGKRVAGSRYPVTASEIEALIAYSCQIYDDDYMGAYFETLSSLALAG